MRKYKWSERASGIAVGAVLVLGALMAGALGAVLSGALVWGAQIPQIAGHRAGAAYDMARESVISGKIVQYSAASTTPPPGAHITLQSSSGTIEVHAGNAKLIEASHISLQAGDAVSVTGENVTFGNSTVFVARVIQKGSQSLAVRSKNGVPLLPTAVDAGGKIVSPAGAR
jgi:hypothetical protein